MAAIFASLLSKSKTVPELSQQQADFRSAIRQVTFAHRDTSCLVDTYSVEIQLNPNQITIHPLVYSPSWIVLSNIVTSTKHLEIPASLPDCAMPVRRTP